MEVGNLYLKAILMKTGQVILRAENLPRVMCLHFQGEPFHGNPNYRNV
ncbi:hypothetical protein LINGRAHAP2_LOCUS10106 [Linum grandiflorum]